MLRMKYIPIAHSIPRMFNFLFAKNGIFRLPFNQRNNDNELEIAITA